MNGDHDNLSERERRLGEIVFAYLQAVEKGQPHCQRELLTRYPQFADELKEFLADEHCVHLLTQPLRPGAGAPCPNPDLSGKLPTFEQAGAAPVASSPGPLSVPYGDYELLEELGRGGMAVVYKARQKGLDRIVALKMIRTDRTASATDLQRFRQEIEAVAKLDHPHIAPIYAVGPCEGNHSYFFTSKLVENGSLDRHLARFRDDPRATVRVLIGTATAICYAHRRGILHRDLKPSNILLDSDDSPLVIDFGLAKHLDANLDFTRSDELVGTPPYMAPEQVRGHTEQITAATDIYGLGAVLYTLLTGQPPFQGETILEILGQISGQEPKPPRRINQRVDRDLESICLKCLEKEPARRYSCAGELLEDLQSWQFGRPIRARRTTHMAKAWRWCKRYPVVSGLLATIFLLLTTGIVWLSINNAEIRLAREQTVQEQETTDQQRQIAEYSLYVADIQLAQRAWDDGQVGRVRELLEAHRSDRRGWEWAYLDSLCHRELAELTGHPSARFAVFSPGGTELASTGDDHTLRIWDLKSGQLRLTLPAGRDGLICWAAWSADGKRLAAPGADGQVVIWDPATGKSLQTLSAPGANCVDWSPDGAQLIAAYSDRSLRVWDTATGVEKSLRRIDRADVRMRTFVDWSPTGRYVAESTGLNDDVRVWDTTLWQPTLVLKTPGAMPECTSWSPDGSRVAVLLNSGSVVIHEIPSGSQLRSLENPPGEAQIDGAVAWSGDGKRLAAAAGRAILVWDAETGRKSLSLRGHSSEVTWVAWHPGGEKLASICMDGSIRIWSVRQPQEMLLLPGNLYHTASVAWNPRQNWLASTSHAGTTSVWDVRAGRRLATHPGGSPAWSSDGGTLTLNYTDGRQPTLWDIANGKQVVRVPEDPAVAPWSPTDGGALDGLGAYMVCVVTHAKWSPGGNLIAASCNIDEGAWDHGVLRQPRYLILLFDAKTHQRLHVLNTPDGTDVLTWRFDGSRFATGDAKGIIRVWDAVTGGEVLQIRTDDGRIGVLAWSPDGRRLVSAGAKTRIWDPDTGRELIVLPGPVVNSLDWSPDGTRLAFGGADGSVGLWDAAPRSEDWLPDLTEARVDIEGASALLSKGLESIEAGQYPEAVGLLQQAARTFDGIVSNDFEAVGECKDAAVCHYALSVVLPRTGSAKEADTNYAEAEKIGKALEAQHSDIAEQLAEVYGWVARQLAEPADASEQDVQRAVELAERAVRPAKDRSAEHWTELGMAYYRAGKFDEAIEALEKPAPLRRADDPAPWVFLAMAHGRLGHKEMARQWYDKASACMQEKAPVDDTLHRLYAEAATSLGLLATAPPELADLWSGQAEFRCEDPQYAAMSVNLNGPTGHSGDGKLSIDRLRDGRLIGVYRTTGDLRTITMAFSRDGLNFSESRAIAGSPSTEFTGSGWGKEVGDPAVNVCDIQEKETIFVFYEAAARQAFRSVGVNTGMMWSEDQGVTWKQQAVPLTDSAELPDWGNVGFRGTSGPTAVMHMNRLDLFLYWTASYGSDPNHSEVGAGVIPVVRPGTHEPLSLNQGGLLDQRQDGSLALMIGPPQRRQPVMSRGPFDWCKGAVDIGNVTLGNDGIYYAVFVGGEGSESQDDDVFSCGLARTSGMTNFEKKPQPILKPHGPGRRNGISYPMLIELGDSWYLYYVVSSRNFDGCDPDPPNVPNPSECHARLKLQWRF